MTEREMSPSFFFCIKNIELDVAQWLEHLPGYEKTIGSISLGG
jgi:hypothetical protein